MRVVSVTLRDFRSYARAEAHLGGGLTIVHGPNGAGKSNLLEAIFFGCTGHSLRARNDRELLRFGASAARVEVTVAAGAEHHELSVGYGILADQEKPVKRMRADGAVVERLLDVETRPLLGVFLPDRLELVKGPPAPRRAHLDRLVAAIWPLRKANRRAYSQALAQRNALLAGIRSGRASHSTLPHMGPRTGATRDRAARRPRRGRRVAARALHAPRRAVGPERRARAALPPTLTGCRRRAVRRRATRASCSRARAWFRRTRTAPRRAALPARRPRVALLRLAGRAAPGAAGAAACRARRPCRTSRTHPTAAAGRRDERARPPPPGDARWRAREPADRA